jgi:CheY-like chemotaxis protein
MVSNAQPKETLAGLCILVVEDEMMVAIMLEEMLTKLGCKVVKAARVSKAVQLVITAAIDGAILDVNVAGEAVYPVAHKLQERGIPFIFSSGYGASGLPVEYRDRPTLSKPFQQEELAPILVNAILGPPIPPSVSSARR